MIPHSWIFFDEISEDFLEHHSIIHRDNLDYFIDGMVWNPITHTIYIQDCIYDEYPIIHGF